MVMATGRYMVMATGRENYPCGSHFIILLHLLVHQY